MIGLRVRAASILRRYWLVLLSAIALNLTFFPYRQEYLVWLACVPLFVWLSDARVTGAEAFYGLMFVGTIYHFTLLSPFLSLGWWGWGLTTGEGMQAYFSYQHIFMAVLIAIVSVWGGVVLSFVGWLMRPAFKNPLVSLFVVPSAWVLILEYLGHGSVFGFSWGLIGNRLHFDQTMRQLASVAGPYGLSFLVVSVNVFLASWVVNVRQKLYSASRRENLEPRRTPWFLFSSTVVMIAVMSLAVSFGHRAMRFSSDEDRPIKAALLQGARAEYSEDDFTSEGLDQLYGSMIDEAASHGAGIVVLPETVWFRTLQLDSSTTTDSIMSMVSPRELHQALIKRLHGKNPLVVFGIDTVSGGKTYNTTTFWTVDGLVGLYRKRRLVPFSEYRPAVLGGFAPQSRLHERQFHYTPGSGSQLVRIGSLLIGPFICQEVMFPNIVRRTARDGAQLLVTTGNDGVFSSPVVAWEQANLASLRAVENGRYLLRCMKTGISAIIDPQGRVIASAPVNSKTIIYAGVRPKRHMTLYTLYGDWIVLLCAIVVALTIIARLGRRLFVR